MLHPSSFALHSCWTFARTKCRHCLMAAPFVTNIVLLPHVPEGLHPDIYIVNLHIGFRWFSSVFGCTMCCHCLMAAPFVTNIALLPHVPEGLHLFVNLQIGFWWSSSVSLLWTVVSVAFYNLLYVLPLFLSVTFYLLSHLIIQQYYPFTFPFSDSCIKACDSNWSMSVLCWIHSYAVMSLICLDSRYHRDSTFDLLWNIFCSDR